MNRRNWKYWVIVPLILLFAQSGMTQIDSLLHLNPTLEDLMNMEVTTASKTGMQIDEAPANVYVITDREIRRRGYRTLEELFKDLPGFDFSTGQPAGEYPSHFLFRGISDVGQTKFMIMVDWIVQNDISNGWIRNVGFDFTVNDIKRVEVISGPGSALYGANAFAGLVHIITKTPEDYLGDKEAGISGTAQVSYGSNNTISPEIMVGAKTKNGLKLQVAGRWYYTQGDGGLNRPDPGNYFHNNFEPDSVLTTEYGWIANERLSDSTRKPLPDGFNTGVNDFYFRGHASKGGFRLNFNYWERNEGLGSEVVGYEYFTNTDGLDYQAHHSGTSISGEYQTDFSSKISSITRGYYRNTNVRPATGFYYTFQYQSVNNGVDTAVVDKKKSYNGDGFVIGMEQQLSAQLSKRNNLVFGVVGEQLIRQYWGISLGSDQDPRSTRVDSTFPYQTDTALTMFFTKRGAIYLQDAHDFGKGWGLTAGVRYDYDQQFGDVINPRLALVRNPQKGFGMKVLMGQAFKAPTVFELYDEWRGNVDLEPERVTTAEVEMSYRFKNMELKTDIFTSRVENLIVVLPNPNPVEVPIGPSGQKATYYQNKGSFDVVGLTFRGDFSLSEDLYVYGNYALTLNSDFDRIPNVSAHKLQFGGNYELLDKADINVRCNYYGKVKAPESNRYFYPKTPQTIAEVGYDYMVEDDPDGYTDGFFLVNMTLTGKNLFGNNLRLQPQLIVRNLLGTKYVQMGRQTGSGLRPVDGIQPTIANPVGFSPAYHPQPGREIFLALSYTF